MCETIPPKIKLDLLTRRISIGYWVVEYVRIKIGSAAAEPKRIFADESLQHWMVVARSVVIESCPIIFPPRVLDSTAVRRAAARRLSKRLIGILRLRHSGRVGQCQRRTQTVRQEVSRSSRIGPGKDLVDSWPCQQIRCHRGSRELLWSIHAIIQKHRPARIPRPPADRIISEANR